MFYFSFFFLLPCQCSSRHVVCGENSSLVLLPQSDVYLLLPRTQTWTYHWNHVEYIKTMNLRKVWLQVWSEPPLFQDGKLFSDSFFISSVYSLNICIVQNNKKINETWLPSDSLHFITGDKMIKSNPNWWPEDKFKPFPTLWGSSVCSWLEQRPDHLSPELWERSITYFLPCFSAPTGQQVVE